MGLMMQGADQIMSLGKFPKQLLAVEGMGHAVLLMLERVRFTSCTLLVATDLHELGASDNFSTGLRVLVSFTEGREANEIPVS